MAFCARTHITKLARIFPQPRVYPYRDTNILLVRSNMMDSNASHMIVTTSWQRPPFKLKLCGEPSFLVC